MTTHLSLNTVIHAAVRRDLARLVAALNRFPVGSRERATELKLAWTNLDHQLTHHHTGEEEIFWPALRALGADEALVTDLDGEHERMAEAMVGVREAMTTLAADASAEELEVAKSAVAALRETIESHFAHEERDLEPSMASAHDTPEMKAAQAAIRKTMTPREAGVYFAWLQDDAGPDERAYLRKDIPAPALFLLSKVVGRSYGRVAAAWG